MKLISADVLDNYSIVLTMEVREDLDDVQIGQILQIEYIPRIKVKIQPTVASLDDVKNKNIPDGYRRVRAIFMLPTKYTDYVNVCGFLYLLSGKVQSSNKLDYNDITSSFYGAYSQTEALFSFIVGDKVKINKAITAEEANEILLRTLVFLNQTGTISLENENGVPTVKYCSPGERMFFKLFPLPRDLREVMITFINYII